MGEEIRVKNRAKKEAGLEEEHPLTGSHPSYPRLTFPVEPSRKRTHRRKKGRSGFASTTPKINGSRVIRGARYSLMADILNGRLLSFVGLLGSLLLGSWLLTSPDFKVTQIEVKNGHFLDQNGVVEATGVDQQNVFLLNEGIVAEKLKKLSSVLEARVSKAFPNSLVVEVTERYSILNWQVGGTSYLIDREGIVLESYMELPPLETKLVVIRSLDEQLLNIGDRVDPVAVRSAPLVLKKLEEIGFGLESLEYTSSGGLIVRGIKDQGSRKIIFGTDAELAKKAGILKSLMADRALKWTFADLRFTVKPAIQ